MGINTLEYVLIYEFAVGSHPQAFYVYCFTKMTHILKYASVSLGGHCRDFYSIMVRIGTQGKE